MPLDRRLKRLWTYDDLLEMPDDGNHYEIIAGDLIQLHVEGELRRWTCADLLAAPDDGKRWEIIDGHRIELTTPDLGHATVVSNLLSQLLPLRRAHGLKVFTAPLLVFLSEDTMMQPDIACLLPDSLARLTRDGIDGAPDLMVEVISLGMRSHDIYAKREIYRSYGINEYWIVDPVARSVDVQTLREAHYREKGFSGDDTLASPLLPCADLPLAAIFADLDGIED